MLPSSPLATTEATGSGVRSVEVMTCVRGLRGGWGSVRSLVHASVRTPAAASEAFIRASRLDSLNLKGIRGRSFAGNGATAYGRQTVMSSTQTCSTIGADWVQLENRIRLRRRSVVVRQRMFCMSIFFTPFTHRV